eukprot:1844808-Rhodomonas_salina.1
MANAEAAVERVLRRGEAAAGGAGAARTGSAITTVTDWAGTYVPSSGTYVNSVGVWPGAGSGGRGWR